MGLYGDHEYGLTCPAHGHYGADLPYERCPKCDLPSIEHANQPTPQERLDTAHPRVGLWRVLVPTVRRVGGRPYHTRYHRVWDARVRQLAGGLTVCPVVRGQWVDVQTGTLHAERMIQVEIACTRAQIDTIVDFTLVYYDQLAVMASQISDNVILRTRQNGK